MLSGKQTQIEQLSQKLLEGYTLLAASCPQGGNVPLVQNRKTGEAFCVHCNSPYVKQGDDYVQVKAAADIAFDTPRSTESEQALTNRPDAIANGVITAKHAAPLSPSSRMETTASGQAPEQLTDNQDAGQGAASREGTANKSVSSQGAPNDSLDGQALQAGPRRSDRISALIAEKLLEGWTLLNEVSPFDSVTPLVRNRDGRRFCVSSNLWVVTEEEAAAMKLTKVSSPISPSDYGLQGMESPDIPLPSMLATAAESMDTGTGSGPARQREIERGVPAANGDYVLSPEEREWMKRQEKADGAFSVEQGQSNGDHGKQRKRLFTTIHRVEGDSNFSRAVDAPMSSEKHGSPCLKRKLLGAVMETSISNMAQKIEGWTESLSRENDLDKCRTLVSLLSDAMTTLERFQSFQARLLS